MQRDLFFVASGSANAPAHRTPYRQAVVAALSWVSVVALILWAVFLHRPAWAQMLAPGVAMLLTFFATIVGVPIVRWLWRDHGGNRKDGPWRPS